MSTSAPRRNRRAGHDLGAVGGVSFGVGPSSIVLFVATILLAGTVNGITGFGFALVGTMVLASVVDPATAVVFMILPILSVNLSLVRDLSASDLRSCGRRFGPLLAAALVGTVVGTAALDRLPAGPLRLGLGVVTLGFVVSSTDSVRIPGATSVTDRCFLESVPAMVGVGAVSGALFGGTNVGVQLIAYLKSRNLPHGLFVGVVALVFLGLNGVRVGAAGVLGLYPTATLAGASLAATVPAVAGVALGKRLRDVVPERWRDVLVLSLLTAIGLRLVSSGLS